MLDRELVEAVKIAREAGAILMEVYATDFSVEFKGERDPVTIADRRANEHIVGRLRDAFPADGIVAEESPDKSDAMRRGRCWYIDPLDGTKEFIAKNGEFSVMIGLAIDGSAKLGVVYKPAEDTLYRGVVGDSAFREVGQRTYALSVTPVSTPSELGLVVSRSHRSDATDRFAKALGIVNERRSGSVGLKVGLIAQRDADLYVHLSEHSWAWDACAPDAILRAAGGCFVDLSGESFVYGGPNLRNRRGILACNNAETLDEVRDVASEIARDLGLLNGSVHDTLEEDAATLAKSAGLLDPERTLDLGPAASFVREAQALLPPHARSTQPPPMTDSDGDDLEEDRVAAVDADGADADGADAEGADADGVDADGVDAGAEATSGEDASSRDTEDAEEGGETASAEGAENPDPSKSDPTEDEPSGSEGDGTDDEEAGARARPLDSASSETDAPAS